MFEEKCQDVEVFHAKDLEKPWLESVMETQQTESIKP